MLPLLPLMMDTVMVVQPDVTSIVHEWGVVVFEQSGQVRCGSPGELHDPGEITAEAPVIWIHGEPFSGEFIVETAPGGAITFSYPFTGYSSTDLVSWTVQSVSTPEEERVSAEETPLYSGPYEWAVEWWRAVPSLRLEIVETGEVENFLYYECSISQEFTGNFFTWSGNGNPVFPKDVTAEALYFTPYGVFPVQLTEGEFMPLDLPMAGEQDPLLPVNTFCGWAGGMLKSEEITALWETWKPVFTRDGEYWLVFPIPFEHHREISTIELVTGDWGEVEYQRLFLGAVNLRRTQ